MTTRPGDIFTADFKETPYWWDAAPPVAGDDAALPNRADVAIVGSGFTGLNAAIDLARAGRNVVVIDAEDLGHGASTRNAGFLGRTLKSSFTELLNSHGADYAVTVYKEMQGAFDSVLERIREEKIDCGFKSCGRLILTKTKRQYDDIEAEMSLRTRHMGGAFEMMPGARLRNELASRPYFGAALIPDLAALHPGLYHRGLLNAARAADVTLVGHAPATQIAARDGGGFTVTTTRGTVEARDVLVATNGYTGPLIPYVQRRFVPFDAYAIVTEPVSPEFMNRVLPTDRTYTDHVHDIIALRRTPDNTRIYFLWRTCTRPTTARDKGALLHADASAIVPEFAGLKISHSWHGRCAGTFDLWPHLAVQDGVHIAGGYCFAGIPMGTYLGRKAAARILGRPEAKTVFAERSFPSFPFYAGNPWFVPHVMNWYRLTDRWASRGARAA